VFQLEGWDVGAADDFIRGVHVARCAMGLGVPDLWVSRVLAESLYKVPNQLRYYVVIGVGLRS
jgi:hypothetical protein